jgi:hypothetical protein
MSGVETAEWASCPEDTKPTGTAYGRMMDELVRKLNGVVQRASAADVDIATIMRSMDKYEERLAKLENPLRSNDYSAPTYGPPNYGDGVKYPNVQPHNVSLLRAQLKAAAMLLHTARDCIRQCVGLANVECGWEFADQLDEVDVAYWMQENPRQCLGAFDLTRLKASIKK